VTILYSAMPWKFIWKDRMCQIYTFFYYMVACWRKYALFWIYTRASNRRVGCICACCILYFILCSFCLMLVRIYIFCFACYQMYDIFTRSETS
jgi:hypothetical protein